MCIRGIHIIGSERWEEGEGGDGGHGGVDGGSDRTQRARRWARGGGSGHGSGRHGSSPIRKREPPGCQTHVCIERLGA